jgi:RNA-directed DNA polymerase
MLKYSWTPIRRHILVKGDASPDDSAMYDYWIARMTKQGHPGEGHTVGTLAERQHGFCPLCNQPLWARSGDEQEDIHVDHIIPKNKGGSDRLDNLRAVHMPCHQQRHSQETRDNPGR